MLSNLIKIDCAWVYGNEHEVGAAIRNKINEGIVKREDLFIVSKLWNIFHQPDQVQRAFDMTMEKLDCDYLDLYLMHFPVGYQNIDDNPFPMDASGKQSLFDELDYMITYEKMEDLIKSGQECVVKTNFEYQVKNLDYKKVQRARFIQF